MFKKMEIKKNMNNLNIYKCLTTNNKIQVAFQILFKNNEFFTQNNRRQPPSLTIRIQASDILYKNQYNNDLCNRLK